MKSGKSAITHSKQITNKNTLVGFNPAGLVLDTKENKSKKNGKIKPGLNQHNGHTSGNNLNNLLTQLNSQTPPGSRGLTAVQVGGEDTVAGAPGFDDAMKKPPEKALTGSDLSLIELRNYAVLMDQFSLHNFMIYNGE